MTSNWLNKEWEGFQNNPPKNIFSRPIDNNMFHWRGEIIGASETSFEGGVFNIDIASSHEYPLKSPKYTMLTMLRNLHHEMTMYFYLWLPLVFYDFHDIIMNKIILKYFFH
jgi:ubiquitin-protein ligase